MERNAFLIVTKQLAADKRISATAKLLLAQLGDHWNRKTGQCNPRRQKLADELGVSLSTVMRELRELKKVGMLEIKRTGRASRYAVAMGQNDLSDSSKRPIVMGQIDPSAVPRPLSYEPYPGEPSARAERAPDAAVPPKPPGKAGPEGNTLSIVRDSLLELATLVHLAPPDEAVVRRVVDAARGSPGDVIHATLVAFWKRGRLNGMRSWGLLPALINGCFEENSQPASGGR